MLYGEDNFLESKTHFLKFEKYGIIIPVTFMDFKFCVLSSGSSGNASVIVTPKARFLIDAGFCGRQLESLLYERDILPESLDGILITHEHTDHIKGCGVLARKYHIPVLANRPTWQAMLPKVGRLDDEQTLIFRNDQSFQFRDLTVRPFSTHHDAACPCGFVFSYKDKKISVMTDTGLCDARMVREIAGSDIYLIEANHDVDMLLTGPYPYRLKNRILSAKGHLSNDHCLKILEECLVGKSEQVFLGHLSQDNNLAPLALDTVKRGLSALGFDIGEKIRIEVANRFRPNEWAPV